MELLHNLKKLVASMVILSAFITVLWLTFHVGFITGYHTREAEYGTLQSLEQRGLISAEEK